MDVKGSVIVLEAAADAGVARVLLASSSSVYGKSWSLPYDEAHPTELVSPYGVSKLSMNHYTRVDHELHDLTTVSLQ